MRPATLHGALPSLLRDAALLTPDAGFLPPPLARLTPNPAPILALGGGVRGWISPDTLCCTHLMCV